MFESPSFRRLNPCSNGIPSDTDRTLIEGSEKRLNPCSNGIPSDPIYEECECERRAVLIPVLMEYPLTGLQPLLVRLKSLNPCSNGIPSDLFL